MKRFAPPIPSLALHALAACLVFTVTGKAVALAIKFGGKIAAYAISPLLMTTHCWPHPGPCPPVAPMVLLLLAGLGGVLALWWAFTPTGEKPGRELPGDEGIRWVEDYSQGGEEDKSDDGWLPFPDDAQGGAR